LENYIFHFNEAFSDTSSELYNEQHMQSGIDSEDIQYVNDLVVINSNLQPPNPDLANNNNPHALPEDLELHVHNMVENGQYLSSINASQEPSSLQPRDSSFTLQS
jgi:hypothetical protein